MLRTYRVGLFTPAPLPNPEELFFAGEKAISDNLEMVSELGAFPRSLCQDSLMASLLWHWEGITRAPLWATSCGAGVGMHIQTSA